MMNGDESRPPSFSFARRWGSALNLVLAVAAVVALVGMVNYLAIRHFSRWHLSQDVQAELSKRTLAVLRSLTNNVKVVVYYDSEDPLYPRVKGLLKEYEIASPHIQIQWVDYLRDGGTAKLIKQTYNLNALTDRNLIVFDYGGRTKIVNAGELSDYDYSGLVAGQTNEVNRTHFKGEQLFTSRLFSLANEQSPIAYFLIGHAEHQPDDLEKPDAYGKFSALLYNENNFALNPLVLGGTNQVPADCSLLIINGPRSRLDRTELDAIQSYLEQGGRLLVSFNSETSMKHIQTGLERLLTRWGVEVSDTIVVDQEHSMSGSWDIVPVTLGQHPVVNSVQNSKLQLFMPRRVGALKPMRRTEELRVEELLLTGPNSVIVTDLARKTVAPDQKGPAPLMTVVEKSIPGLQRGTTRIAVLGDSSLWNNQWIEAAANREFAASTVNWLVNQSLLLGDINRQAIHNFQLSLTQAQLRNLQLALLLGLPGAVLFLGWLVWLKRRL